MRRAYQFADGTLAEPRDVMGRGAATHPAGWYVTYPDGQRTETRENLQDLRARFGKAKARS